VGSAAVGVPGPAAVTDHWFEAVADHAGPAYLRYSFTKGTEQEVDFLVEALGLGPGQRVLDVGCGPGRHSHALARRGIPVHGVDISQRFVDLATENAPPGATFERMDARRMGFDGQFDVAISLCQGGFGLAGDEDGEILARMASAVRAGGRVAFSAFSAYFAVRFLEDGDSFDAGAGVNLERTTVLSDEGEPADFDLWTSCFTPRELRLMCAQAGLTDVEVWSVTPGRYGHRAPSVDEPEFLVVASR
jgi:SAM-dependent methyltransferase